MSREADKIKRYKSATNPPMMRLLEPTVQLLERLCDRPYGERPGVQLMQRADIEAMVKQDSGPTSIILDNTGAAYSPERHRVYLPRDASAICRDWYLTHELTHGFMRNTQRLLHAQSPELDLGSTFERLLIIKGMEEGVCEFMSYFTYTLSGRRDAELEERSDNYRSPLKADRMLSELREHVAMVREGLARSSPSGQELTELNEYEVAFLRQYDTMTFAVQLLTAQACYHRLTGSAKEISTLIDAPPRTLDEFASLLQASGLL
jgi:hypothetical protein